MSSKARSDIGRLLRKCGQFFETVSDDELGRFLDGSLKLVLVAVDEAPRESASREPRVTQGQDLERLAELLRSSDSREAAASLLRDDQRVSGKSDLTRLARLLHVHVTKQDKRETIEEKIVEAVIGVRLRSEAIHGLNLKGGSSGRASVGEASGEEGAIDRSPDRSK